MPQVGYLPRQSANISGVVAPGAVLRFYQTGTSTPQNAYTDAALSNAVTSLTADAAGLLAKWYLNPNAAADYRYTLETSAGAVYYTEDGISRRTSVTQADVGAALYPRTDVEEDEEVTPADFSHAAEPDKGYSVLRTGADPTGATSSDDSIASAITVAKLIGVQLSGGSTGRDQGVDVYLPAGLYTIDNPIVLPRGGNPRAYCVGLIGDGESTRIQPSASFPAGRGLIEWEATTARVFNQRIRNLKLEMRDDLAHKAIFFELNDPTTTVSGGQIYSQEEIKELYIEGVQIHGSNEFHEVLVDIEGKAKFSRFDITADMVPGDTQTYSTIILRLPSDYIGTDGLAGDKADSLLDNAGINYSYVNVFGVNSRGGSTTAVKGRIHNSFVERLGSATGAFDDASVIELYGSTCNTFAWIFCEGRQEDPQVYLEECHFNQFLSCNVGTPDSPGPGTAFGLVACEDNVFWNHPSADGKPAYSGFSGFLIDLDANCKRNRFHNFHGSAAFDDEIRDLGTDNYIEYYNEDAGNERLTRTHWPVAYSVGPFTQDNISANQTDVALSGTRWIAPRAGSITAIMVKLTEARTAGNLTFKVFRSTANLSGGAGAELHADLQADFSSLNTEEFVSTFTPGEYAFGAGDEIFMTITSNAGWTPTTSDVRAYLEVQC